MNNINPIYKVNEYVTYETLYDYGFRKTISGEIIYRFVVYKYKTRKPLIFCEFIYNELEKQIHIITKDINGNSYNYNEEEYGKSDVVEQINKEIHKKLNTLLKEGIIKK